MGICLVSFSPIGIGFAFKLCISAFGFEQVTKTLRVGDRLVSIDEGGSIKHLMSNLNCSKETKRYSKRHYQILTGKGCSEFKGYSGYRKRILKGTQKA